ncbi:MAG: amylo-alpha-1,6-glucosidase [Gemmatales bacterium]|nr:MAG: amylo-alpha-1,6-glucosidase [Gemmatales bacterium]
MATYEQEHDCWTIGEDSWRRIHSILKREAEKPLVTGIAAGGTNVIVVKDPYYITTSSPAVDVQPRVLKHGDTFAVFDRYGDIRPTEWGEEGIFHDGTRLLSGLVLKLEQRRPFLLSSTVQEDNVLFTIDLTNPDIHLDDHNTIPRGTVHLFRSKFLLDGAAYESLRIFNYGSVPLNLTLSFEFHADFADIFEVRGMHRQRRGRMLEPVRTERGVVLGYQGLDDIVRRTRIELDPAPTRVTDDEIQFEALVQPKQEQRFILTVRYEAEPSTAVSPPADFRIGLQAAREERQSLRENCCQIHTSNEQFNDWVNRSLSDLLMMVTRTPAGLYPYAGVPWFSTAFGRDGIITALQCLWLHPGIARGVLEFLAQKQARDVNDEQDAEPGKILHETRRGEMAALREIPFGLYYGSVDATPLFVMLAAAYFDRTADRDFIQRLWPHIDLALNWIDHFGDRDGDGFVEYHRHSRDGLVHQGWKDSHDSVFHSDGSSAEGPIALCEVQGYVYAAKCGAARLAEALGDRVRAASLHEQANRLRDRFEQAFWCEDLATYALALDGQKHPCRVRTSNAGHCLFSRIASPERAKRVGETLLDASSFSGFGIRTVAEGEARYNPMSYHNGTIWPHDNALIAAGLAHYRLKEECIRVLSGMFDASLFMDFHRLPELFCGFPRRPHEGPTHYPVACSPQSWAAGSVFLLLQACLGLEVDADNNLLFFRYPLLPQSLQEIQLYHLRVGNGQVDLRLRRHDNDVGVEILRREGPVEINIIK